jgi:hypothetical protein
MGQVAAPNGSSVALANRSAETVQDSLELHDLFAAVWPRPSTHDSANLRSGPVVARSASSIVQESCGVLL